VNQYGWSRSIFHDSSGRVRCFCADHHRAGSRIVKQYEKGIILRFGKFHALANSGLTFIMPFTDSIVRVDMREQVISVPPQKLITKDNVTVEVDAVVYYKVVDPVKSQFRSAGFRLRLHHACADEPAQPDCDRHAR